LIGPAPCFFGRINDVYRWHLIIRSPDPTLALEGLEISRGWLLDMDPVGVL
jgi:primosomal protein N' (replication factor Y)